MALVTANKATVQQAAAQAAPVKSEKNQPHAGLTLEQSAQKLAPTAEPRAEKSTATNTASYYRSLSSETRGGFTQRILDNLKISKTAADYLNSGSFAQPITRVQAAAVASRILNLGSVLKGQPSVFNDVPLSHWGATSVYRAQEEGIFRGQSTEVFNPDGVLGKNSDVVIERVVNPSARVSFNRNETLKDNDRNLPDAEQIVAVHESRNPQITKAVYQKHKARLANTQVQNSGASKSNADAFQRHWNANKTRYINIASRVNMPANLIAALHWRESSGDFSRYFHNGDPLGKRTVNVPKGKLFHKWEDSVVDALKDKARLQKDLNITKDTTDEAALAAYSEYYNGLGYHNKGVSSPYVYSGTNQYSKGKYVSDGKYSSSAVDKQVGVVAMLRMAGGNSGASKVDPRSTTLLEGQVHVQGKPIANANVFITDSAGVTHNVKTNDSGLLHLKGKLNPGMATVSVNGVVSQVSVKAGSASWAAIEMVTRNSKLYRTLQKGSSGADVAAMQTLLNNKGNYKLTVDGEFGEASKNAVKAFQRKSGLAADGVVGNATWSKLIA